MIYLDLKDLRKDKIYIIRYNNYQIFKTGNKNTLKRLLKGLKILDIKNYHIYTLDIRKEQNI